MHTILWVDLGAFLPALFVIIWKYFWAHSRKKISKSPQSEKLLRPAGYSLQLKLDKILDSMLEYLFTAMVFAGGAVWVIMRLPNNFAIPIAALLALPSFFFTYRVITGLKEAENYRLGLRGEQAVAEALTEVSESGYRTFNDFVVENGENEWNIDHMVVGNRGLFLIETKARRRPRKSKSDQPANEVVYDGNVLRFPNFRDAQPLQQAKRNAEWLENYLRKKTGEYTPVEPLVVLPGWFVKLSVKSAEVKVMNPTYMVSYLQDRLEKIPAAQVTRIITAIEENCRTLEF